MTSEALLRKADAATYLRQSQRGFERHVQPFLRQRPRPMTYAVSELNDFIERLRWHRIYFLRAGDLPFLKIGWTTRPLKDRLVNLQNGCPVELRVHGAFFGEQRHERAIHRHFASLRVRKSSEWFHDSDELLALAKLTWPPQWLRRLK